MRIAIIGSGIAGLGAAYLLAREHEVVVYEAEDRLGGHTHTHDIDGGSGKISIDTGFIVFNPDHYPLLTRLFAELGVESQPTTMSFAVKNELSGLEYNATNLNRLFCQRSNLLSPPFWRMVLDILRFYRESPALLRDPGPGPSLGEYLREHGYGRLFIEDHLLPMASALWSSPTATILDFPARYLVQFMANHQMLDAGNRPPWRVVKGGSARYLDKLVPAIRGEFRTGAAVRRVERSENGVRVFSQGDESTFDQVVFACHSDQALAMLDDPSDSEREILGAIKFQRNDTVLHTDASLLPKRRAAWAAWNALKLKPVPGAAEAPACTVSYCMNLLQSLSCSTPYIVTLNATQRIAPERILARMDYAHPVYTHASVAAQGRWSEINGLRRSWYCGAYWGWGFHEDGLRSGVRVASALGCRWD
ncbi:MAG: FAD-dependent oxidoreductase [Lysobacterales bacterium]|nr:FAD-dependent oxidoreductase [Xanthomonadales bacterium]MCB1611178.1 FAD-dependent oxidoreductase [Xanthomonadales bacterium]MCP5474020.1 FAD-dependent oxidoreductase [Rhodanobacteraceae bacterium]